TVFFPAAISTNQQNAASGANQIVGVTSGQASITADSTPPTGSITINNNDTYTNSTSVTLNLNAADVNGTVIYRVAAATNCSTATFLTHSPAVRPYRPIFAVTLPAGNATNTHCVPYEAADSNSATSCPESITADSTPPTGSMTINNNATYSNSTSVTLNLNAT